MCSSFIQATLKLTTSQFPIPEGLTPSCHTAPCSLGLIRTPRKPPIRRPMSYIDSPNTQRAIRGMPVYAVAALVEVTQGIPGLGERPYLRSHGGLVEPSKMSKPICRSIYRRHPQSGLWKRVASCSESLTTSPVVEEGFRAPSLRFSDEHMMM